VVSVPSGGVVAFAEAGRIERQKTKSKRKMQIACRLDPITLKISLFLIYLVPYPFYLWFRICVGAGYRFGRYGLAPRSFCLPGNGGWGLISGQQFLLSQSDPLLICFGDQHARNAVFAFDVFINVGLDIFSRDVVEILDIGRIVIQSGTCPPKTDGVSIV